MADIVAYAETDVGNSLRGIEDQDRPNLLMTLTVHLQQCFQLFGRILPAQVMFRLEEASLSKIYISDGECQQISELVKKYNIPVFVHSSLSLNISLFDHIGPLQSELYWAQKCGFQGVVVHVGHYKTEEPLKSQDQMHQNIIQCLPYASESCRLLLETPAGQGSELCISFEEFYWFYNRFDFSQRLVFGLCIDTCHVFAAGHDPTVYIKNLIKRFQSRAIGLLHFNDSRHEFGRKVDRHAPCGQGYIGAAKLSEVSQICRSAGILMVREY